MERNSHPHRSGEDRSQQRRPTGRTRTGRASSPDHRARAREPRRPVRARGITRVDARRRLQVQHGRASTALARFRQATFLTVALTTLLFMLWDIAPAESQEPGGDAAGESATAEAPPVGEIPTDPQQSLEEAAGTIRQLFNGFLDVLPKVLVALLLLLLAWLLSFVFRQLVHRFLRGWQKSEAVSALGRIVLFLLAIGAGLSVIAGDVTALVGSVGLTGLALSWALQTPIESFSGWVLNAMRGYYRPGDRIEVGNAYGDVYRIDVLTTTVWEAGGPGKAVTASQPTGALITFPNWEILRSNIINYSRDFPFVWDEVTFAVANESDLKYTVDVFRRTAAAVVGEMMRQPAADYRRLLDREQMAFNVEEEPQVYLSLGEAWTNCTVRYLVSLRERRRWSSELILALSVELARPEHRERVISGYPRTEVDFVGNATREEDEQAGPQQPDQA